jgi:hypothetical protein
LKVTAGCLSLAASWIVVSYSASVPLLIWHNDYPAARLKKSIMVTDCDPAAKTTGMGGFAETSA